MNEKKQVMDGQLLVLHSNSRMPSLHSICLLKRLLKLYSNHTFKLSGLKFQLSHHALRPFKFNESNVQLANSRQWKSNKCVSSYGGYGYEIL